MDKKNSPDDKIYEMGEQLKDFSVRAHTLLIDLPKGHPQEKTLQDLVSHCTNASRALRGVK